MENKLKWISSNGGPLVLIHEEDREEWFGGYSYTSDKKQAEIELDQGGLIQEKDFTNPQKTHYGKACEVAEVCGTIKFNNTTALVLGDQPALTSWLPSKEKAGGILVRWIYAENEESVTESLYEIPNTGWQKNEIFRVNSKVLILFDSFTSGRNLEESEFLTFELEPENYEIETLEYQRDQQTYLRLHRLVRSPDLVATVLKV
ncbi:MAG: Imm21 family immunity protein [Nostoc sp.]